MESLVIQMAKTTISSDVMMIDTYARSTLNPKIIEKSKLLFKIFAFVNYTRKVGIKLWGISKELRKVLYKDDGIALAKDLTTAKPLYSIRLMCKERSNCLSYFID